jgi:ribosome biogenesis GTPase A
VANKVDLLHLPGGIGAVRLRAWLKAELRRYGISFHSVQLVSAKTGEGVAGLMRAATQLAAREDGKQSRDLYLVGAVNTGKSLLLNKLIDMQFVRRRGELVEAEQRDAAAAQQASASSFPLTSSLLPGTTLGLVGFPLVPAREGTIFDTPGVVSHPLPPSLLQAELRALLPTRPITPVTYRLKEGQCLLLGGLARIDLVSGRPFFFTVYASAAVSHHVSSTQRMDGEEGAEAMLRLMEQGKLSPPFTAERFHQLGLSRAERLLFVLQGRGWLEAGADVVFPGVGWVAVTGVGQLTVRASIAGTEAVEGEEEQRRLPFAREPLMPFDARTSTTRFHGADRRIDRYRPPASAAVKRQSLVHAVAPRSSRAAAFSSRSLPSRLFSSASTARFTAEQPSSPASSASTPAVVPPSSLSASVASRGRPQWSVYKQLLQQHAAFVQTEYRKTEHYLRRPKGSWRQQQDGAWLKLFRKKNRFTRPGSVSRRMQQKREARQQQLLQETAAQQ